MVRQKSRTWKKLYKTIKDFEGETNANSDDSAVASTITSIYNKERTIGSFDKAGIFDLQQAISHIAFLPRCLHLLELEL